MPTFPSISMEIVGKKDTCESLEAADIWASLPYCLSWLDTEIWALHSLGRPSCLPNSNKSPIPYQTCSFPTIRRDQGFGSLDQSRTSGKRPFSLIVNGEAFPLSFCRGPVMGAACRPSMWTLSPASLLLWGQATQVRQIQFPQPHSNSPLCASLFRPHHYSIGSLLSWVWLRATHRCWQEAGFYQDQIT